LSIFFPINHEVERQKMKDVCLQCHSNTWTDAHFVRLDKVVEEYNEVYFKPVKKMLDDLYAQGLLEQTKFFDEELEIEFYEKTLPPDLADGFLFPTVIAFMLKINSVILLSYALIRSLFYVD
jgi:hypothetical protein